MKKSKAFTLAEVLITLVIIGVIAAMTIPTLMGSTNNQEYRSKFKKALSALNQSVMLERSLYGNHVEQFIMSDTSRAFSMLKNHLSVIEDNDTSFVTADGIAYTYLEGSNGLDIDLNGKKGGICRQDGFGPEGSCMFVRLEDEKGFFPPEADGSAILYD